MKTLVCFSLFAWINLSFPAGSNSAPLDTYRAQIYKAYVENDLNSWSQTLTQLKSYVSTNRNRAGLYELSLAQYGLIGFYRELGNREVAIKLMNEAEDTVDEMLEMDENWAIANCFKGGLLGLETEFYPAKVVYLGPRALSYYGDGKELGPNSPEVWVELGNLAYHAPEIFGGDKAEAAKHFAKAIRLFDAKPALKKNNWLYLHAQAWLGRSYVAIGKKPEAKKVYERLQQFEPEFHYMQKVLIPELNQ